MRHECIIPLDHSEDYKSISVKLSKALFILCACMQACLWAWTFAWLINYRGKFTVLSLVHLQPFGDSLRPVGVSRHRLSLSSLFARLQTSDWLCCVWLHETVRGGQRERDGKKNRRHVQQERQRGGLNLMFVHSYVKKQHDCFSPATRLLNSFIRYFLCLFKNKLAPLLRCSSCSSWLTFITSSITLHSASVAAVAHST